VPPAPWAASIRRCDNASTLFMQKDTSVFSHGDGGERPPISVFQLHQAILTSRPSGSRNRGACGICVRFVGATSH
jgi:hypothetical protein